MNTEIADSNSDTGDGTIATPAAEPGGAPDDDFASSPFQSLAMRAAVRRAKLLGQYAGDSPSTRFEAAVTIHGDYIEGDKFGGHKGKERDSLLLSSPRPLERPPFVDPPYFASLIDALSSGDFVVVHAQSNVGCRTAAIRALADLGLAVGEVDPRPELGILATVDLSKRSGLIVDKTESDGVSLSQYEADLISQQLRDSGSKLVVLAAQKNGTDQFSLDEVVVAEGGAPPAQVVHSWMTHYLGDASALMGLEVVAECLAQEPTVLTTRDAVILAKLVSLTDPGTAIRDRLGAALSRLASSRSERVSESISRLLGQCTTEDAALLISALVLAGSPEAIIVDASRDLSTRLADEFPESTIEKLPFSRSLSTRIAALEIKRASQAELGGSASAETTLSFADPSLTETVLQHIWFEYGLQSSLSTWLVSLPKALSSASAIHIATAVAQLMRRSPDLVISQLVSPWATSSSGDDRIAAAMSLGMAAWVIGVEPQPVLKTVQRLIDSSDWRDRWTAALSLGLGVGQRFPRFALANLDVAISDDEISVRAQAIASLRTMMVTALEEPDDIAELTHALIRWVSDRRLGAVRREALVATLLQFTSESDRLQLFDSDESLAALASLVGALLSNKDSRAAAQRLLRHIILASSSLPLDSLARLVSGLTNSDRDKKRINFLLTRFASSEDQTLASTAELIRQQIKEQQ